MKTAVGFSLDGISLNCSLELEPQTAMPSSVRHLALEERESVLSEVWSQMHPRVCAQLNASLQQLGGEILREFELACLEKSLEVGKSKADGKVNSTVKPLGKKKAA